MARGRDKAPRPGDLPAPGLDVLGAAVYTIGALFIVVPVFDLLLNLWPLAPGDVGWRYGATGLFANFLHTPLLGALIITLFAGAVRHARVLRIGGALWLATAVLLTVALVVFCLDALQLRPTVLPESRLVYHTSVARAAAKHLTGAIAFGLLGAASWRLARSLPRPPAKARTPLLARRAERTPPAERVAPAERTPPVT